MTDAEYFAIKDRAAKRLLAIPHVNGVGVGGRQKNGQPTGEIVLKVFVTRKKAAGDVPPDELIPASFEGVPTDVVELGPRVKALNSPGAKTPVPPAMDETYTMPLQGGTAIYTDGNPGFEGTMGCLLRDRTDGTAVYGLTNYHVVAKNGKLSPSWRILQIKQSTATSKVGEPFATITGGGDDKDRDAAVARLDPGMTWTPAIKSIGLINGSHDVTVEEAASLTYQVRKRGARTGLTGGVVVGISVQMGAGYKDAMVVWPNPDPAAPDQQVCFSDHGDSGSVLVNDDNQIVGLLRAGEEGDAKFLHGYAAPIAVVLARFEELDGLDLEVPLGPWLDATPESQAQTVLPIAGAPVLPAPQAVARGDAGYYRPLIGGSQMLASPMMGAPNAATLGCFLTDPATPGSAYALTCYSSLTANGTIPPTSDTKIGQPDNHSSISGCCASTFGHFTAGDTAVPAAVVRLEDDQPWVPELLRLGVVLPRASSLPPLSASAQVKKHGAETRLTGGTVTAVGGQFGVLPANVRADAILVRPNPNPTTPTADICFSQLGDRGAVIVDSYNLVFGVLYDEVDIPDADGRHVIHGLAAPIGVVLAALKQSTGIAFTVAGANAVGHVQTTRGHDARPRATVASRLDWIEDPPGEVPAGAPGMQWIWTAWRAHRDEIRYLIDHNRKVAVIWRRNGGPALVQAMSRAIRLPSARLPALVNGVPIALCRDRVTAALTRYGSPPLRNDLARLQSSLPAVEGLGYHDMLVAIGDAFGGAEIPGGSP